MYCVLIGFVPPIEELWDSVREEVTSVNGGVAVKWTNIYSLAQDDDNDGATTLVLVVMLHIQFCYS